MSSLKHDASTCLLNSFVSPVLAALGDPLSHGGVESVSAHMRVLTVWIEQLSQGCESVLLRTLSCHGLQVLHNIGSQHHTWKHQRNRNKALYLNGVRLFQSVVLNITRARLPELDVLHASYMMSRSSCSENPLVPWLSSMSFVPQPGDSHTSHVEKLIHIHTRKEYMYNKLIHSWSRYLFNTLMKDNCSSYHRCCRTLPLSLLNPWRGTTWPDILINIQYTFSSSYCVLR